MFLNISIQMTFAVYTFLLYKITFHKGAYAPTHARTYLNMHTYMVKDEKYHNDYNWSHRIKMSNSKYSGFKPVYGKPYLTLGG